jgi:hypothetical protein
VTALTIRVGDSRLELPYVGAGRAARLVVAIPSARLKADRGTVIFPWLVGTADRLVVKVYGEMGVFNWLRKQVVGYRARREFHTLEQLRTAGISCCEPMFWGTGRSPVHGLFEVIATREIPGASTLAERMPGLPPGTRAEILGRFFEALACMHRQGVFHGVAYLTNVLVAADPATATVPWLVDLEKSIVFDRDIRGSRMADYDLLCAVSSTFIVLGNGYARAALERYGLDRAAMARVFAAVERTRSSKFGRYRRRAEFLARGVLSRRLHTRRQESALRPDHPIRHAP